ncbi:MAG: sodium:solute symporter family protein, partial [Oscillospiraceae bacterium]|nr:sodium:solute symporter family protein [Oscillospiraceae bacterium]
MNHSEISWIDLGIVGVYLVAMIFIGVYFVRRIKNTGDYYVAGRSFGPLVLMATVCATIIGGSGLMGRAGKAYDQGFMAIMTALPYLIGMFIFSGISGRISDIGMQHNITSIPELFEKRFGKTAKLVLAALIAFTMMGTVASQVTATATIIKMVGGSAGISYELGAVIACVVFMIYTATSGLFGVVYTDVFQFYMLLLFVYILIPVASLREVGSFSTFVQNLDPELVKPKINGSILGDIVTYLVFTMAGAEMWQRAFAARDRKSAKKGMFLGTAVYGVTILLVYFMGVVAHQIIGDDVLAAYGSTDAVVPALAIKVLPIGLTGLALAGLLSVIMSTADSYLLVSVQTCVHDIGKTIHPKMADKREIALSRVFSIVLPIAALVIALYIKNAYDILMFAWSFYAAACGLPCFAALYWRKATKAGVLAGMIAGFAVCVGWKLVGMPFGLGA